jgi:hypothetical protein
MRPEYDFNEGVRGKHYRSLREGHTITVHQEDGTTFVQQFILEENTVVLEPDVYEYFPDSESVNHALRILISLAPEKKKKSTKIRRGKVYNDPSSKDQLRSVSS